MTVRPDVTTTATSQWRAPGVWLALLGATYLLINVVRVGLDRVAFAAFLGLPLATPADAGWVVIYASRTAALAILALYLLARGQLRSLAVLASAGALISASDAVLTGSFGAGPGTVARHVATTAVLLLTAALLARRGDTRNS